MTMAAWAAALPTTWNIVAARPEDLPKLPAIELAAARLLAGIAPEAVLAETTSHAQLEGARAGGRLWVAVVGREPVGFAHIELIEAGRAHLQEIDVLPEHGRQGIGRALVMHVCRWAASRGYRSVTLTTFRDVPWNMPFYARVGFEPIAPAALTPALRRILQREASAGLDPERRVAMRCALDLHAALPPGTGGISIPPE